MSELTTSIREEAYAMSHADRLANARRSLAVAAFAVCAHTKEVSYVSELTSRLLLDGHAWLIANAQNFSFLYGGVNV